MKQKQDCHKVPLTLDGFLLLGRVCCMFEKFRLRLKDGLRDLFPDDEVLHLNAFFKQGFGLS